MILKILDFEQKVNKILSYYLKVFFVEKYINDKGYFYDQN